MADGAGWFADPSGKISTYRWWDGQAWTRWLSADPAAPAPGPQPPSPTPAAGPSTGSGPMPTSAGPIVEEPEVAPHRAAAEPVATVAAPTQGVVRLPLAAAIIVGGVLLAVIAVGAIVSLSADRPLTGPAVAPPPPTQAPLTITYDEDTRAATVEELQVVLPAAPFDCRYLRKADGGPYDATVSCGATVHEDYNDDDNDWSASVGLGLLDPAQDPKKDLRDLLASAASDVLKRYYTVEDLKIEKVKNQPSDVAPKGQARVVTAELHYSYPGLSSEYDALRVTLVRLASGRYVIWWGLVPDDSPEAVTSAASASATSLTARK